MKRRYNRLDFLEALFEDYYRRQGNFILVRKTVNPKRAGDFSYYPSIETLAAAHFPKDTHVFFGVCPRRKMKPGKEHVRHVTALWAGLDVGSEGYSGNKTYFATQAEMMEAVEASPLMPSIMVRSGRGVHLYWLLKEVKELANVEALERLLGNFNRFFRCETLVPVDSTMRLPDTTNPRYEGPKSQCYIEYVDPELRYSGTDFRTFGRVRVGTPVEQASSTEPPTTAFMPVPYEDMPGGPEESEPESPENADSVATTGLRPVPTGEISEEAEDEYCEVIEELDESAGGISLEELEALADKIIERMEGRFLTALAERLSDLLVDKVVDRLTEKLSFTGKGT